MRGPAAGRGRGGGAPRKCMRVSGERQGRPPVPAPGGSGVGPDAIPRVGWGGAGRGPGAGRARGDEGPTGSTEPPARGSDPWGAAAS